MMPVRDVAQHRWPGILAAFGLDEKQLSGRHTACPVCGGRDRFRFDDKDGRGTFYCSHCGAGDGIKLVMAIKGLDFKTAAQEVEALAGVVKPGRQARAPDADKQLANIKRVWADSTPLQAGDEAVRYLAGRGLHLSRLPDNLRLHPSLPYHDGEQVIGHWPAMIARVQGPDGSGVTLHRTYLSDGGKAPVESPKKLMPSSGITGAAIRLSGVGEHLGIAEGIETALAASELFGMPVWSCISAAGVESFTPPAGVRGLVVFADNDESFAGQKAAYAAAFRIKARGIDVDVKVPPVGDWLDVLAGRSA